MQKKLGWLRLAKPERDVQARDNKVSAMCDRVCHPNRARTSRSGRTLVVYALLK
jgi:hypothetical protein